MREGYTPTTNDSCSAQAGWQTVYIVSSICIASCCSLGIASHCSLGKDSHDHTCQMCTCSALYTSELAHRCPCQADRPGQNTLWCLLLTAPAPAAYRYKLWSPRPTPALRLHPTCMDCLLKCPMSANMASHPVRHRKTPAMLSHPSVPWFWNQMPAGDSSALGQ
jgi:hypothetical protein